MKKCVLTIVGILFLVLPGAAWGEDFRQWLEGFYPRVANEGISRATWETAYGTIFDKPERLHYVPQALATLAYADPKRKNFAEKKLVAVLQILQAGDVGRQHLTGSWAGAMGHTQFIPTSYLAYAVDMDGKPSLEILDAVGVKGGFGEDIFDPSLGPVSGPHLQEECIQCRPGLVLLH